MTIRLAKAALSRRIYAGTPNKAGNEFKGKRHDVTCDLTKSNHRKNWHWHERGNIYQTNQPIRKIRMADFTSRLTGAFIAMILMYMAISFVTMDLVWVFTPWHLENGAHSNAGRLLIVTSGLYGASKINTKKLLVSIKTHLLDSKDNGDF